MRGTKRSRRGTTTSRASCSSSRSKSGRSRRGPPASLKPRAARLTSLARVAGLPKRFPDRDEIAAVRAEAESLEPGQEAATKRRVAGRVMGRRDLGKIVFLDLVDRSGRLQLLCPADRTG